MKTILMVVVLFLLANCETPADRCTQWDIVVIGYEVCAKDSQCKMEEQENRRLVNARIQRAKWCGDKGRP